MIHSSRRDRRAKAIAEVLAMIAGAQPERIPCPPRTLYKSGQWLKESATRFSANLDADQAAQIKRGN
ncbi:hypothetical protein CU048_01690 [Beijerinckiaceae bacterium]|nr:hypothetical protein CU048_01690 [Beijerinckiaceae bacterium]